MGGIDSAILRTSVPLLLAKSGITQISVGLQIAAAIAFVAGDAVFRAVDVFVRVHGDVAKHVVAIFGLAFGAVAAAALALFFSGLLFGKPKSFIAPHLRT